VGSSVSPRAPGAARGPRRSLRSFATAPWLGAALVLLVATPLAATLNIWIDEAYTLHTTGSGLGFAWQQAEVFELQPPLYFVLLAAWRELDERSVFFARIPSLLFAAATVYLIVRIARRAAPDLPPVVVAAVTALNPIVIWAAGEMRGYAAVLFIGAALTSTFIDGFFAEPRSRAAQVSYAVVAALGLYTQYYVGFVLLAHGVLLIGLRRAALRSFIIVGACVTAVFAPFVPVLRQQLNAGDTGDVRPVSAPHALHEILNASYSYVLPHDIGWTGKVKLAGFVVSALLFAALLIIGRPALRKPGSWIALTWLLSALTFCVFFALAGEAVDVRRHVVVIVAPTLLTAYALISSLRRRRGMLAVAALVVYAGFTAGMLGWMYDGWPPTKTGDWRRLAALVSTTASSAPIAVFPSNSVFPLGQYMPSARFVTVPRPMPFTAQYLRAMTIDDETQVATALAGVRDAPEIWLVSDDSCDGGPRTYDFHCPFIFAYFKHRYDMTRELHFHGAAARLFTLRDAAVPDPSGGTRR
jgi:hypothetical protein